MVCERQGTLYQGHALELQAALDDPGDPVACWVEQRLEDGTVIYVEQDDGKWK
jgi:hypothetical protein